MWEFTLDVHSDCLFGKVWLGAAVQVYAILRTSYLNSTELIAIYHCSKDYQIIDLAVPQVFVALGRETLFLHCKRN